MSRIWSGDTMQAAQPINGWGDFGSITAHPRAFRSMYGEEAGGKAWNVTQPGRATRSAHADEALDPIEAAAQEAFVQGFQEGERVTRESLEADDSARTALAAAIGQFAQAGEGTLATLMSEAVIRVVGQIMGEVAIDEALLQERCAAVAACIDSEGGKAVLEVNPEDIALLDGAELGVALTGNAALPRGAVRLATADGWVEDGPDVRLARLRALMDDMEGRL